MTAAHGSGRRSKTPGFMILAGSGPAFAPEILAEQVTTMQQIVRVARLRPDGPIPVSQRDLAFSPGGTILASATGTGQVTLWNVTDPAHASRMAALGGAGDFIQAFAFSPRGNLLAAVTYHGTVLVYSLADPARPARTARHARASSSSLVTSPSPPPLARGPDSTMFLQS